MSLRYETDKSLSAGEFLDLLQRSGLAERRPSDLQRLGLMLEQADVLVTAWSGSSVVGVSRAITDFSYVTYLSDLAVDRACQRQGIGRELINLTHAAAGRETRLVLLAAPAAESYYPAIGLEPHHSCWMLPPIEAE